MRAWGAYAKGSRSGTSSKMLSVVTDRCEYFESSSTSFDAWRTGAWKRYHRRVTSSSTVEMFRVVDDHICRVKWRGAKHHQWLSASLLTVKSIRVVANQLWRGMQRGERVLPTSIDLKFHTSKVRVPFTYCVQNRVIRAARCAKHSRWFDPWYAVYDSGQRAQTPYRIASKTYWDVRRVVQSTFERSTRTTRFSSISCT